MADKRQTFDASLTAADFNRVSESIIDEWQGRKTRRHDREKQWAEIDRQIAMEPEISHKLLPSGRKDKNRAWMPETELPLQAETLEMLTADCRRLKFPASGGWYRARAALTDDYLERFTNLPSPIPNDVNEEGSALAQDNADRLAEAAVAHWHRQYDFRKHVGMIDAETFKYGFGVGRLRRVRKRLLAHDASGNADTESRIPVLVPRSAKRVYLDDSEHAVMHEGHSIGPNIIQERLQNLADLRAAAADGGSDPEDEDGGWRPEAIRSLEARKDGTVALIELEGDLVIETSDSVKVYRNVVATAAVGEKGSGSKETHALVRLRRGEPFCTYLVSEYHEEDPAAPGCASPLTKGRPIAKAAAQALNRVIESGLLKIQPPIGWPRDDIQFANDGGPVIYPGAQWATVEDLHVYMEVGGDPSALFQVYLGLLAQYADVSGVNAPRLGAQTRSHTTAFAKDAEITRGTIRTLDYVLTNLSGPMTRLLELEYRMGRGLFRRPTLVYVDAWNEFVRIQNGHLPDVVSWRAIGAGQPLEEAQRAQSRLAAAQLALQVDAAAVQLGRQPALDHRALVDQILREGGWTDVDAVTVGADAAEGTGAGPEVGGPAGVPGVVSGGSPLLESF